MRGLYCITPDYLTDPKALNNACRAAIRGGAQIIQFRQKTPGVDSIALAYAVMDAAAATTARVLINDDPLLAQQVGGRWLSSGSNRWRRFGCTHGIGSHRIDRSYLS